MVKHILEILQCQIYEMIRNAVSILNWLQMCVYTAYCEKLTTM